jgi:hypothetical protein
MYNGVYAAAKAPHLLFTTDLAHAPVLAGRQKIGRAYIELLPALPITDGELETYDVSPGKLLFDLRESGALKSPR